MMLTEEKQEMPSEMQDMMMNNEFVGKMHEKASAHSECAIMGLIKNQMFDLQEELKETKVKYADASLQEENWSAKYERRMACKILEGKISILDKLKRDFENMLTPMMASN